MLSFGSDARDPASLVLRIGNEPEIVLRGCSRGRLWGPTHAGFAGALATDPRGRGSARSRRGGSARQPVAACDPPTVKDEAWPLSDLDRHVLARLEKAGLKPARDADRTALLRRLYFDLIGLPPTPQEVESFVADRGPGAIEKVVDRLLVSLHFGER